MGDRNSFVFYRSFKDSLKDLSNEDKLIMYEAICDYSLDKKEPQLTGFPSALFTLIRPNLDANLKRWQNGLKGGAPIGNRNNRYSKGTSKVQPNNKQSTTKIQTNKDVDKDYNVDVDNKENISKKDELSLSDISGSKDYKQFRVWMKDNASYCDNPKHFTSSRITEDELKKLREKYSYKQIINKILELENRKDLRKRYINLYRTINEWLKRDSNGR
jgi:hypothetical protein